MSHAPHRFTSAATTRLASGGSNLRLTLPAALRSGVAVVQTPALRAGEPAANNKRRISSAIFCRLLGPHR